MLQWWLWLPHRTTKLRRLSHGASIMSSWCMRQKCLKHSKNCTNENKSIQQLNLSLLFIIRTIFKNKIEHMRCTMTNDTAGMCLLSHGIFPRPWTLRSCHWQTSCCAFNRGLYYFALEYLHVPNWLNIIIDVNCTNTNNLLNLLCDQQFSIYTKLTCPELSDRAFRFHIATLMTRSIGEDFVARTATESHLANSPPNSIDL